MANIAEIHITINEKNEVNVVAPFEQNLLCFGMLELARQVITEQANKLTKRIDTTPLTKAEALLIRERLKRIA